MYCKRANKVCLDILYLWVWKTRWSIICQWLKRIKSPNHTYSIKHFLAIILHHCFVSSNCPHTMQASIYFRRVVDPGQTFQPLSFYKPVCWMLLLSNKCLFRQITREPETINCAWNWVQCIKQSADRTLLCFSINMSFSFASIFTTVLSSHCSQCVMLN